MTIWQPVVNPVPSKSATSESNCEDIEVIRGLTGHDKGVAINVMIERNLPLVFHKVEIYISLYPSVKFLADDLVCEGLLALTQAVHKLAELDTPEDLGNASGYIGQRIIWAITRLVENDEKQQIPSDYRPPGAVIIESMAGSIGEEEWTTSEADKIVWKGNHYPVLASPDVTEMVEIKESLLAICQTPEDVIIIEMREQGSTDLEIAARLDISRSAVRVQRHDLLQRYEALEKTTQ